MRVRRPFPVAGVRPSPPGLHPRRQLPLRRPMELHLHWLAPYPVTHFLLLFLRSRWRWSPPSPHVLLVQAEAEGGGLIRRADGRRRGSWPWMGNPSLTRRRGGTTVEEDGFAVAVVHVDLLLIPFLPSNMWIEGGGASPPAVTAANRGGLPQHFLMRGGSGSGGPIPIMLATYSTECNRETQLLTWIVLAGAADRVQLGCRAQGVTTTTCSRCPNPNFASCLFLVIQFAFANVIYRRQHLQCALLQVDEHLDGMVVGNCSAEDKTRKEHEKIMPVVVVPLEFHPGHYPQHGLHQRSSPAANTKGRGDAEMSTQDEHTTIDDLLRWQAMRKIFATDALWTVIILVLSVYVFVTIMA
uniref:Uncharacterized protein n=1 Tax=Oryza meridionalis TaxID=40149 RepID=A0A0E0DCG2_9ORYZ